MKQYLVDLIKINGPIPVSSFMNEALFNPKHGYYNSQKPFGKGGDFVTAPEISQVFGELIAAYLINLWQVNYGAKEITLVEMGAGQGTLMKDFLFVASKVPNFLEKVTLNIIEISPKLQEVQKGNLKDFNIKWWSNFDDFYEKNPKKPIFFLANELFDCFAINQYLKIDNSWIERRVGLDKNNNLQFILDKQDKNLDDIINNLAQESSKKGDVFEHSVASDNFMTDLSGAIKKTSGVGLVIDYGYIENNFKDSLQAIRNHRFSDVLQDIGKSDITALVNFKRLEDIAKKEGLKSWTVSQKEFLESLGVEIRRQSLIKDKAKQEKDLINSSIDRLIDNGQMGELFKCLIFC